MHYSHKYQIGSTALAHGTQSDGTVRFRLSLRLPSPESSFPLCTEKSVPYPLESYPFQADPLP